MEEKPLQSEEQKESNSMEENGKKHIAQNQVAKKDVLAHNAKPQTSQPPKKQWSKNNQIESLISKYLQRDATSDHNVKEFKSKMKEIIKKNLFKRISKIEGRRSSSICVTEDRNCLIIPSVKGELSVYVRDSDDEFKLKICFKVGISGLSFVSITPDGSTIVCGSKNGKIIKVWKRKETEKNSFSYKRIAVLKGHSKKLRSISTSSDAKIIVSGAEDKTVKVWNWKRVEGEDDPYELLQTLKGHSNSVEYVFVSSCGGLILSGSKDKSTRVWIKKKEEGDFFCYNLVQVIDLKNHSYDPRVLSVSADGMTLVFGSTENRVCVWRLNKEEDSFQYNLLDTLQGHMNMINSVSVSGDGKYIVSCGDDHTIRVWGRREGEDEEEGYEALQVLHLDEDLSILNKIGISFDGRMIISSSFERLNIFERTNVHIRSILKGPLQIPEGHADCVNTVSVAEGGSIVVSGSGDHQIKVWSKEDSVGSAVAYRNLRIFYEPLKIFNSVSTTEDGGTIVSGSNDRKIRIWRGWDISGTILSYEDEPIILDVHRDTIHSIFITPDGRFILSGSRDKTIQVLKRAKEGDEAINYKKIQRLEGHSNSVTSVYATPDGLTIVSGSEDQTIRVWAAKEETLDNSEDPYQGIQSLEGHCLTVTSVSITPDRTMIASASFDKTVRIWKEAENLVYKEYEVLEGHSSPVTSASISPNGKTVISGSLDKTVKVWVMKANRFILDSCFYFDDPIHDFKISKGVLYIAHSKNITAVPYSHKTQFFSSLETDYFYSSIFDNAMSKKTKLESLNYLYKAIPGCKGAKKPPNRSRLLQLHHGVNPLFWFSFFGSVELLKKGLVKWGYSKSFYKDCKEFDPFLHSLKSGDQDLVEVWADYFLAEENTDKIVVDDVELFMMLLSSKSEKIQKLAIKQFMGSSKLTSDIEGTETFGLSQDRGFVASESDSPLLGRDVKDRLLSQQEIQEVGTKVNHQSTFIPISQDLSRLPALINTIKQMTPENKLEMRPLILTIYNKYRKLFYLFSVLSLIGKILLFTTIVFQYYTPFSLVAFYIIYSAMLIFEIIDMFSKGVKYFFSVYNWFDILLYPAGMGLTGYVVKNGYKFLEQERENFLVVLVLYLALMRAVSMLRVLDSTRYLILMILRVYLDITPFFVVLLMYILGNGCILILINITKGERVLNLREFKRTSDIIYNWGYGNWDDPNEMNDLIFFFYIHTGLFIGLVMFNLLIAIISGTYEEYTEDRMMVDLEEILDMLSEMANFLRVARSVKEVFVKGSEGKKVFYHFIVPDESQGEFDEIQQKLEEVGERQEEMIDLLRKKMAETHQAQKEILTKIDKRINSTQSAQQEVMRRFEERMDTNQEAQNEIKKMLLKLMNYESKSNKEEAVEPKEDSLSDDSVSPYCQSLITIS